MANEVGNQVLEPETTQSEKVNYKLIQYQGINLPQQFKNLVVAPFLNSLRYGNDYYKLIDKESYFAVYPKFIDLLIQRSVICFAILDEDTVLGWSMVENKTLHYIWVKQECRRNGIGRALLPLEFDKISHITNKGINIWVNKFPNVSFDPFI